VEPRTVTMTAPKDDWAEVQRWSLRAQALAELRALSESDAPERASARTVVLP
jgi:hypothetical protein